MAERLFCVLIKKVISLLSSLLAKIIRTIFFLFSYFKAVKEFYVLDSTML